MKDGAGKTVRFSAWIKTENVRNGYAGQWWRVDGPREGTNRPTLAFDNSQARIIDGTPDDNNGTVRGATGTTPWTLYEFELPVGKTASNINFGVIFMGRASTSAAVAMPAVLITKSASTTRFPTRPPEPQNAVRRRRSSPEVVFFIRPLESFSDTSLTR